MMGLLAKRLGVAVLDIGIIMKKFFKGDLNAWDYRWKWFIQYRGY